MIQRHIIQLIQESLSQFPAVLINGARQVGKSTLAQQLKDTNLIHTYVTLDDLGTLEAATLDPDGFLSQFRDSVAIDEVQRAPDLLRALKKSIDADRRPGRFLLTGSANILSHRGVSESLAGRMDIVSLEGLSFGELLKQKKPCSLITDLFILPPQDLVPKWVEDLKEKPPLEIQDISEHIFYGGFPDVALKKDPRFRDRWFSSYQASYIERDVRDLSRGLDVLSFARFFRLVGLQTGQLVNFRNLGMDVQLDQRTVARYLELLEMTFQVNRLIPWHSNSRKQLIKTPKIYMNDSGQACYLAGIPTLESLSSHPFFGALLETWVWAELRKLLSLTTGIQPFFYRTQEGKEVDFLLSYGHRFWGIEIKAKETLTRKDFSGLEDMIDTLGPQAHGLLLYRGHIPLRFSDQLIALPLRYLA